ncbi:uncharacterized protein YjbJ (UPF0337 family) [Azospirillum agricola]|uniref:hypothetical protein n=1 Tax=Azospirillum agricola TaxID=1720247 RepID=UPI001AE9752D|nr:hypothetical protein [Azospirillum agricola]MBP2231556.1 uncharacterized protein YjbJ (UPF0337 family) [Azospirillum agricola]
MTRPDAGTGNTPPDLDRLEGEIRASRARIDGTVDALRGRMARLSPRTLMERKMSHSYTSPDHGSDRDQRDRHGQPARNTYRPAHAPSSMMGSVTSNPIPLALIGVGLGWLALSTSGYDRRIARSSTLRSVRHRAEDAVGYARDTLSSATDSVRSAASSAYDSASEAVGGAYDSASNAVGGAYDSASSAVGSAYDSASSAVGGSSNRVANRGPGAAPSTSHSSFHVRERMHDVSTGFWDMVEDHPMVAGAMGVALGAAIGAALPSTQSESRWVGPYADEATERAKTLAMDALDRGTRAAQAAVEAAKEEVTEAASSTADAARSAAREEAKKPA